MKKVLTIIAVVVLMIGNVIAQITYEHAYNVHPNYVRHPWFITDIGNKEYKYVSVDPNGFSVYNLDHTPYLLNFVPPIPLEQPPFYYGIAYLTKSLFDCDSSTLEYAIVPDGSVTSGSFYIYRTDGTLLFSRDSCNGQYCFGCADGSFLQQPIVNTPEGTKLFLIGWNTPGPDSIYVYSLCGKLPEEVFDFHQQQQSFIKVFPNPTSNTLTFEINPPDNMNEYELVVVDANAKEVKREKVGGWNRSYTMDVKDLAGGSYFYSLCTKDKAFGNGKFVINK